MPGPYTIQLDLAGAANTTGSTNTSLGGEHEGGWITRVAVASSAGSPPRGRYYVQVLLQRTQSLSVPETIATLWSGYLTGYEVISIPNVRVGNGQYVFLVVTGGTNGAITDSVRAFIGISDQPVGASWIFYEAPGSGPGEVLTLTPGAPGAGADWSFTIPGNVHRKLIAFRGQFVASASAGNRFLHLIAIALGVATTYKMDEVYGAAVIASGTVHLYARRGGPYQTASPDATLPTAEMPLPLELILVSTDKVLSTTTGIQAADQWSQLKFSYEEWAVPNP